MQKICAARQHRDGSGRSKPFPFDRFCPSDRFWRHGCRVAIPVVLALCLPPRFAHAGNQEDCSSAVADKIESGCTAVINDAARTPDDAVKAFVNRSRLYASRSKFDLALSDASAALELDARSVPALLIRGYVYQRMNNSDSALADFERAIDIDPRNPAPLVSRGFLRLQQKNWAEALKDYDLALALRPDHASALVGRGRATWRWVSSTRRWPISTRPSPSASTPPVHSTGAASLSPQGRHRPRHRGFLPGRRPGRAK